MSASKKSSAKSLNSPAPVTKSSAKAKTAAPVRTRTESPVAMLAPAPVAAPVVRVKSAQSKPVATTINARVDVGFGNAVFIRGEGPGLNWEKGVPMECVATDLWSITLTEATRAYTFKFLVNDSTWSTGPDFAAACGTNVTLTPEF